MEKSRHISIRHVTHTCSGQQRDGIGVGAGQWTHTQVARLTAENRVWQDSLRTDGEGVLGSDGEGLVASRTLPLAGKDGGGGGGWRREPL